MGRGAIIARARWPRIGLIAIGTTHLESWVGPEENAVVMAERKLGLVVCRGPAVMLISPMDGTEEIENPFVQEEEEVI